MASFDIPTDKYAKSFTGINWEGPVASGVMSQIKDYTTKLPQLIEQYGTTSRANINRQTTDLLSPQGFQGTLNQLGARGVLGSRVAADTLSKTATGALKNAQSLGYQSDLDKLKAQMALPETLAGVAKTDTVSTSEDQLEPYRLMAEILQSAMFA